MYTLKEYYLHYKRTGLLSLLFFFFSVVFSSFFVFGLVFYLKYSFYDFYVILKFIPPFVLVLLGASLYLLTARISSERNALKFYNIDLSYKEKVKAKIAELEASEKDKCKGECKNCNC